MSWSRWKWLLTWQKFITLVSHPHLYCYCDSKPETSSHGFSFCVLLITPPGDVVVWLDWQTCSRRVPKADRRNNRNSLCSQSCSIRNNHESLLSLNLAKLSLCESNMTSHFHGGHAGDYTFSFTSSNRSLFSSLHPIIIIITVSLNPNFSVGSSTGSGSCTWSVNTAVSRVVGEKGWRWCRMSQIFTPSTAQDKWPRSGSTSAGRELSDDPAPHPLSASYSGLI